MPDHDGYPTKEELQSILDFEGAPTDFMSIINLMWWHDGFTVKKGRDDFRKPVMRCYLSTWGWSGNEEIIGVLKQTWFWFLWWRKSRRGGHYEFEIPMSMYTDKFSQKMGLPHSRVEDVRTDEIKHFDQTHFKATTIGDRKFVYCPVGNICSWHPGDYDNSYCAYCSKYFSEIK